MKLVIASLLAALGVPASAAPQSDSDPELIMLDGRCDYASAPAPTAREHRLDCKAATLTPGRDPAGMLVQFVTRTDEVYGFAGQVSGNLLTIARIYLPGSQVVPANGGHCKIFFRKEEISGLSCVGDASDATYVANFLVSAVHR
jgi:hypothetical protein